MSRIDGDCVKCFLGEWTANKEMRVIKKGGEHTGVAREIYSMPRLKALGKLCKIANLKHSASSTPSSRYISNER